MAGEKLIPPKNPEGPQAKKVRSHSLGGTAAPVDDVPKGVSIYLAIFVFFQ